MSELLNRTRAVMRLRHYSYKTEKVYIYWMKQYFYFHELRHPAEMGAVESEAFLTHLAVKQSVAASTQNQALAAILFLYREVLKINLPWLENFTPARKPKYLPVVLTKEEVVWESMRCRENRSDFNAKAQSREGAKGFQAGYC
jgi:hypothetical protein